MPPCETQVDDGMPVERRPGAVKISISIGILFGFLGSTYVAPRRWLFPAPRFEVEAIRALWHQPDLPEQVFAKEARQHVIPLCASSRDSGQEIDIHSRIPKFVLTPAPTEMAILFEASK